MSDAQKGILAMAAACVIWGLSAMYYKLVAHVPPLEVLSHRTLWSLVFFGLVLAAQGRLIELGRLLARPRALAVVFVAALAISSNWFVFIYSVQVGHAVQASLGYYIFPLVAVALGFVFLGERHSTLKWLAVALACAAVAGLTWGLGVAPWASLFLAFTFGTYGLVKRSVPAGPVVSVTCEVLLLAPLALIWLWGVHSQGWPGLTGRNLGIFGHDLGDSLLLAFSGPLTATPLILFSYASKRVSYATVGLVQYINPTLQFLVATLVFKEAFTGWHAVAFGLIWTALALYSAESLRQDRAARRAAISAGTSGTR
ncbi:EamA family transporter RarD [Rhodovulum adriaticum]|uniref:Chloramphenicol-sensitive protein RarD n=1 Tax=Rhodovulum adriaticum TaxID=35804 RepID=A0A4R2NVB4_RHOAD|nr:EamA family transporter RarD [Rhodovulum adriaticum]MBK1636465.1 protein RarD [Rhodovulum adriaticum]TCP25531.1 chloramphenicol-sensitive protein RarD [Rhodovulum adriaticum]